MIRANLANIVHLSKLHFCRIGLLSMVENILEDYSARWQGNESIFLLIGLILLKVMRPRVL